MARKNGKCTTIGYMSTLTGELVLFAHGKTQAQGKIATRQMREHDARVLARVGTPDWCELDDYLYPELARG